jgi:hypothetical protein
MASWYDEEDEAWYEEELGDDSFDTDELSEDDEITDLDQLWEYADYDDDALYEYEFHGTGDTGGN